MSRIFVDASRMDGNVLTLIVTFPAILHYIYFFGGVNWKNRQNTDKP